MCTYTKVQSKTKQSKRIRDLTSRYLFARVIRMFRLNFERDLMEEESYGKFIIVWCVCCVTMCVLCSFLWAVEWIHESPPFSFFKPRKEKPPKRPGAVTWAVEVPTYLSCALMSPNFAQCVVLLWIRLIQAIWIASDLLWSSIHITPPCPRLFLSAPTRFLEKGEKSPV